MYLLINRCGSAPADCFSTHSLLLFIRESLLSGFVSTTEAGNKSNDFSCQHEVSIPLLIALHLAMQ